LNREGRILDVNHRATALLRSTRQLLLGRTLTASLTPSSETTLNTLLARVFEGRGPQKGELQFPSSDGQMLELAMDVMLVEGVTDPPQCHLTLTDVTAFKLAHRGQWEIQQAQAAQLEAQARTLRALQEEFEEVVMATGRELADRLTRVEGFLSLSQQPPETPSHFDHAREALQQNENVQQPPETPSHFDHAREALQQNENVLKSLKSYMQVRFMRTRTRSVNLNHVLREALKDIQQQQVGRDVQITSVPLPTVEGDNQVLQIIIGEYLSNALKFTRTRPQARLSVLLEEDATEYRIGVRDNGVGFNMRQKEKAFELFGRLHSSQQYEGSGLGLASVRRLCERFGSRAWGEGKVDQGATFWFSWPKPAAEKN